MSGVIRPISGGGSTGCPARNQARSDCTAKQATSRSLTSEHAGLAAGYQHGRRECDIVESEVAEERAPRNPIG